MNVLKKKIVVGLFLFISIFSKIEASITSELRTFCSNYKNPIIICGFILLPELAWLHTQYQDAKKTPEDLIQETEKYIKDYEFLLHEALTIEEDPTALQKVIVEKNYNYNIRFLKYNNHIIRNITLTENLLNQINKKIKSNSNKDSILEKLLGLKDKLNELKTTFEKLNASIEKNFQYINQKYSNPEYADYMSS